MTSELEKANYMKNLLFFLTLILSITLTAQKIKLNDFKLVAYDIETKNVSILSYSTIDRNGVLKVYIKGYKGSAFYSYQLTNEEIEKVNQLSSEELQSFVARKELEKGMHYAGNRNYITFKTKSPVQELESSMVLT